MNRTISIAMAAILTAVTSLGQNTAPGQAGPRPGSASPGTSPASPAPLGAPAPTSPVRIAPPTNLSVVAGPQGPAEPETGKPQTNGDSAQSDTARPQDSTATRPAGKVSHITPAQLQNINQISAALNALALPGRDVTQRQRTLIDALQAAPIATVRPTPEVIANLGANLVTIVPVLRLTAQQRRQLAIDLNLVLNSGNLKPDEAQRVLADVRKVIQQSAGRNPDAERILIQDLTTVLKRVQNATEQIASSPVESEPPQNVGSPPPAQAGQRSADEPAP